jgi:hypothetical protein
LSLIGKPFPLSGDWPINPERKGVQAPQQEVGIPLTTRESVSQTVIDIQVASLQHQMQDFHFSKLFPCQETDLLDRFQMLRL